MLQCFIGDAEREPLSASHPDDLVRYIHWASTAVLQSASSPRSEGPENSIVIPTPPGALTPPQVLSTTW